MNDLDILRAIKQDKRVGYKVLFEFYYPKMYMVAMRYLGCASDAEDALSESFIRVFRYLKKFNYKGDGSLEKWIVTITVRESIRLLKKRKKLQFLDDETQNQPYCLDIDDQINVKQLLDNIEQLPLGYKSVLSMYCVEGYSHKEIAEIRGISVATSKSQLHKARHYLLSRMTKVQYYELRKNG